ncbi:hypothetical protein BXZ70DRAFT_1022499 [Cristinia sonorae]|uniref:SAGA-associated factor 11 n=1 Tax=Cristinia sonorae TaxID=1940300 RepID=A0A8K0UNA5_9AGAR|nr:hypothetical protein BXZ70DRAFT_1022499 [Cristinia sonorae]
MTKKERDDAIATLSNRIFNNMVDEVIMDVVLRAHREVARSRTVCSICHTRCAGIHVPGSVATQPHASSSQQSPHESQDGETGPNTPVNGKLDGTVYFDCENCKRPIASNRYAPHLSSCLGLGNSRRGAARNATAKLTGDAGRSASPYVASDAGNISDDGKPGSKSKSKSKAKRQDEAEFSLNRKRNGSPSLSPTKKPKKPKTAPSPAAPMSSLPGTPNYLLPLSQTNSQSKIPSKLRESSMVSSLHKDDRSSSPESRDSSPARSISTQASTLSFQSPVLAHPAAKGKPAAKPKNGKPKGTGPPQRRPTLPIPRVPSPRPTPTVVQKKQEHDYILDVEGDETGSSTDTDSE